MTEEKDAVQRILEAKTRQPEHQRLDMEPKVGGQSLLHDEFGIPKVSASQRRNVPVMKEISSDPVVVKASKPSGNIKYKAPRVAVRNESDDDDKFIPPKSNFVSVGHVEHAWYDDKVAGPSKTKAPVIVDNNDEVDVDRLQGINPLTDPKDPKTVEAINFFTKRLNHVKSLVVSELAEITEISELKNLRQNTFGKNGIFTDIVRKLDTLKIDKAAVGELLNQMYSELELEIQGKEFELQAEDEDADAITEWPEDIAQAVLPSQKDEDDEEDNQEDEEDSEGADVASEDSTAIPEGHYAVIIDNKLIGVEENIDVVKSIISKLLLNDEDSISLDRIQIMKRIKIDFGIILG